MDAEPHTLPPLKRLRLLHQENNTTQIHESKPEPKSIHKTSPMTMAPSSLPAKKRKFIGFVDENVPPSPSIDPPTPYCLPTKKRVWAGTGRSPISPCKPNSLHCLPAKKRIWVNMPEIRPAKPVSLLPTKKQVWATKLLEMSPEKSSYCLPAKKRIMALRPEMSPQKSPLLKLDLNIEYTPSPVKDDRGVCEVQDEDEEEDDGILCAVCESTDGDPADPIVFCDGCDLMVHSSCYGNPLIKGIPEGDWYCAQCLNLRLSAHIKTPTSNVQCCCLCSVTGGALKPTNDGRWAHIVCAVLVPEVFFEDSKGRDGIDCSRVPQKRWKEVCYLCKKRKGCAVECSEPKCPLSLHVTCGLKDDLFIELNEGRSSSDGGIVVAFCRKHTDLWKKQQQTGKYKIVARDEDK